MNYSLSQIDGQTQDVGVAEIEERQRKIERRSLLAWGNAIIVILGLTAAVVSLSASLLLNGTKTFWGVSLSLAVRALVGLVLAFSVHMIYQQVLLRRLQHELAEQQIQAEVFRRLAMFDPLTGLYNRRFAEQRLGAEIARSERRGHSLTVVLLDLNDFKQINDCYGHSVGDLVLKEFAQRLNRSIRGSDLAVRLGGDEFMLLLVDCNISQLQRVLVRLKPFEIEIRGTSLPVTFAIGWKEYTAGDNAADLLNGADRQLYLNKLAMKQTRQPVPAAT
jgi:diguanylate cyclase (GGDEF)-like protein